MRRLIAALALAAFPVHGHGFGFLGLYGNAPSQTGSPPADGFSHNGLFASPTRKAPLQSLTPIPDHSLIPDLTADAPLPGTLGQNTLIPDLDQVAIPRRAAGMEMVCVNAIRIAEARHGLPENLLLAIGLQEAGRKRDGHLTIWPWSVNSHGATYMFETRDEAVSFVHQELRRGKTLIDIGCMQVNLRWHPDAFPNVDAGFDPMSSADYAARFLSRLYRESGDWMIAAGNYHSMTPEHHGRYISGIRQNLKVASQWNPVTGNISPSANARNTIARGVSFSQNRALGATAETVFRRQSQRISSPVRAVDFPDLTNSDPKIAPIDGAWWSSDSGGTTTARSIYSDQDLEPVIPILANNNKAPDKGL